MKMVTLEKTNRPEYEGAGVAYTCFVHAIRNGKTVKVGVERSGIYKDMVKYAEKRAKSLKCGVSLCEE